MRFISLSGKKRFSDFVKSRVYRVLINTKGGTNPPGSGSGFFIDSKRFITCFHVIFGKELIHFKNDEVFKSLAGDHLHRRLKQFFDDQKFELEIELHDRSRISARLVNFNEVYDVAILEIVDTHREINMCKLNFKQDFFYGQKIAFGGFPNQFSYTHDKTPFAYNDGIISAFPETIIGGDKYQHFQINSINLSGNSGAPLFLEGSKRVVGIVNGNMDWGRDDLMAFDSEDGKPVRVSNRVPLSIAYATPLKLLRENKIL